MLARLNDSQMARFVVAGGVNYALTYAIYAALSFVMPYQIAFTIGYAAGIVISYLLNSLFVFKQPLSLGKALQFPAVYFVQYLGGLIGLSLLVERLNIHELIAQPLVVVAMIPVTFALSRFILTRKTVVSDEGEQPA